MKHKIVSRFRELSMASRHAELQSYKYLLVSYNSLNILGKFVFLNYASSRTTPVKKY